MIALAALLTTAYAGYVGSPWWIVLLCSATLLVSLMSASVKHEPALSSRPALCAYAIYSLPVSVLGGTAAYFSGQALRLWAV